ncbi:MAG TPA: deoxyribose-phosphate aldolase [Phycisphaerales bacterium]|nr:deoxyribose-phosphate aldolase [Phycisphaerales bacterium]
MYTREQVAATIDHSLLKPFMTVQDVIDGCALAHRCQVATCCVRPCDVALAHEHLKDSGVQVCAVVGFPHGAHRTQTKVLEARLALEDGAAELDMVMNIGRFLSGRPDEVRVDIEAVVAEARPREAIVKVILETCYLSNEQIARACRLCAEAGADFVKTSTGYGDGGATPEVIEIMLRTVGDRMRVKAAGGVRDWATAVAYLRQGCSRLGVSATEKVLAGAPDAGQT